MLQTETKKINLITGINSVHVIILKPKKLKLELLSKSLDEWVSYAVEKHSFEIVEYDGSKITEFVKPYLKDTKYTLILSATTPLIQENTVDLIVDYISAKNSKATKLSVGFAFLTEYLKNSTEIFYDSLFTQNEDEFYVVENKRQLNIVKKVMIERINNFHIENGVEIINPSTVTIEPDVFIGENVTIYPNNVLKGNSKILDDVVLKENNVIEDSEINNGCCIINSKIEKSTIGSHSYVMPYCNILNNSIVGNYCTIKSYVEIDNFKIEDNKTIESYTKLINGEKTE